MSSILPKERQVKQSARIKPQESSYVMQANEAELVSCRCAQWCNAASSQDKRDLGQIKVTLKCVLLGTSESNLALCLGEVYRESLSLSRIRSAFFLVNHNSRIITQSSISHCHLFHTLLKTKLKSCCDLDGARTEMAWVQP